MRGGARRYLRLVGEHAAKNDAEALWMLGVAYEDGFRDANGRQALAPDRRRAVALYRRAASLGHVEAILASALCQGANTGSRRGMKIAMRLERRAVAMGSSTAAYNLGVSHKMVRNYRAAARWFAIAARMGDPSALLELAKAQLLGVGCRRDVAGGLRKLAVVARTRELSLADREEACILLARTYLDGWLVRRSLNIAARWLEFGHQIGGDLAAAYLADLRAWQSAATGPPAVPSDRA